MSRQHADAGGDRLLRKGLIESNPIDHHGLHCRRGVFDRVAGRRVEPDGGELVENAVSGEAEFLERLARQHAGAVDRLAGALMFLEQRNAEAGLCQPQSSEQSGGPAADNDGINRDISELQACRIADCREVEVASLPIASCNPAIRNGDYRENRPRAAISARRTRPASRDEDRAMKSATRQHGRWQTAAPGGRAAPSS